MAEPLNATFFALKKRERSGVLTGIAAAYLVLMIVIIGAFLAMNYQFLGPVVTWYGQLVSASARGATPDPSTMQPPAGLGLFFLSIIPFMFVCYLAFAAFEAACLRWMIRGEVSGFMGLSLGRDTWSVYLCYWIWFFLYIGFSLIVGIISAVVIAVLMMGSQNGQLGSAFIVGEIVRLVTYIPLVFFAVRLAPASAVSVGEKRVAFFDAWKVTKGRFWELFLSFLTLYVLVVIGEIVIVGALIAIFFASLWPTIVNMGNDPTGEQTMAAIGALFTPENLIAVGVTYVILIALSLLVYILFYGINARAVIAAVEDGKIEGVQTAALAKTFD